MNIAARVDRICGREQNRLIEGDTNQIRARSERGAIRTIMGETLRILCFTFCEAGLDAARSETLVAGLKLVLNLAFLQLLAGEKVCVPVLTRTLNPAVFQTAIGVGRRAIHVVGVDSATM